ncbi:eukaryotic translation initiation factor 5A [Brachionus plicatilis]|uniref:Eukaryotic translation initiation factor 5A n=1 Tax=Brachionus plicatilis TaxID=10195 RepID=A0A3M7T096_BRAPC|nr:eukaryotic translation initiation factor 5A [Brachionus plicatilis]
MADQDNEEFSFDQAQSGSSESFPMQCSALRKNGFVLIKDRPCKIVEMSTSKTGKHGHAKVNMVGIDIFTGKKYEDICPSTHNMMVPNVARKEYSLMDITDDGFVSLLDPEKNDTRDDIKLPVGDLGNDIKAKFDADESLIVTVLKSMGEEAIIQFKVENDSKK